MSKEYPFQVPKNVVESINRHHYRSLYDRYGKGWSPTYPYPLALSCFETWIIQMGAFLETFHDACNELNSEPAWAVCIGLEHLRDDFHDLLDHVRLSLPYDPVMRRQVAEILESEESGDNQHAPQVSESTRKAEEEISSLI